MGQAAGPVECFWIHRDFTLNNAKFSKITETSPGSPPHSTGPGLQDDSKTDKTDME